MSGSTFERAELRLASRLYICIYCYMCPAGPYLFRERFSLPVRWTLREPYLGKLKNFFQLDKDFIYVYVLRISITYKLYL